MTYPYTFLPGYYLKLFPEAQQKAASGFLTTLWNKDPFRNKWSLIAKVYSSIRDEVGKGNVSLTNFLETICPIMEIPAPSIYLTTLGWTVGEAENGLKQLLKDNSEPPIIESSPSCPKTELELLQALITIGYMQEEGDILNDIIKASNGGLMTTSPSARKLAKSQTSPTPTTHQPTTTNPLPAQLPEAYTYSFYTEKALPLHNLQPLQTASGFFPLPDLYRVSATPEAAISSSSLSSALSSSSIPSYDYPATPHQQQQQTQAAAATDSSPASSTHPSQTQSQIQQDDDAILRFETIFDHEAFDIDSPWDVDVVLGYTSTFLHPPLLPFLPCQTNTTAHSPGVPLSNTDFDPREDFHYAF